MAIAPAGEPPRTGAAAPAGPEGFAIYPFDQGEVLHFAGIADFYLWPDRIVCHLLAPAQQHLVEVLLLGVVLARWLERQGMPPLHATAVVVGHCAIAFAARRLSGKTSLAAMFMQVGHALLTDDILALRAHPGGWMAQPGYPRMRMWPEQAARFQLDPDILERVLPESPKRQVPVACLGAFCQQPKPLSVIYLPERYEPARADGSQPAIHIAPLTPAEAVFALIDHVFMRNFINTIAHQRQRLAVFAPHIHHVAVRRLVYPSGFEHLPRVREAILADVPARP
jgi:hypothetical protein